MVYINFLLYGYFERLSCAVRGGIKSTTWYYTDNICRKFKIIETLARIPRKEWITSFK